MRLPRLVFGETSRERELRALVEGLQAERERKDRRIAADRKANDAAMAAYVKKLNEAIDERDEARRERDEKRYETAKVLQAEAERDEARRLLKVAAADRDEARRDRDQHAGRLEALQAERDESELDWVHARQEHYESRRKLRTLARAVVNDLREMAANIEVDHLNHDSQEDRSATDSGAEGAGTTPE